MLIRRFTFIFLTASLLACNLLTSKLAPLTTRLVPLTPAYIPSNCQNIALATIPAATALAQPTRELDTNPEISPALQKRVFQETVDVINKVCVYPDFLLSRQRVRLEEIPHHVSGIDRLRGDSLRLDR